MTSSGKPQRRNQARVFKGNQQFQLNIKRSLRRKFFLAWDKGQWNVHGGRRSKEGSSPKGMLHVPLVRWPLRGWMWGSEEGSAEERVGRAGFVGRWPWRRRSKPRWHRLRSENKN